MNNIEILEEFINRDKQIQEDYNVRATIQGKEIDAIENLIKEYKELKEYKKLAELTKISCCTAQNCEALNNAIKNGLENEKLLQENKELKEKLEEKDMQHELELIGKEEYTKNAMGEIIEHYYTANEDCISKSKVKEKIEEINKRIDYLDKELAEAYIQREKLGTEIELDTNEQYIYNMEQERSIRHTEKYAYLKLLEGE